MSQLCPEAKDALGMLIFCHVVWELCLFVLALILIQCAFSISLNRSDRKLRGAFMSNFCLQLCARSMLKSDFVCAFIYHAWPHWSKYEHDKKCWEEGANLGQNYCSSLQGLSLFFPSLSNSSDFKVTAQDHYDQAPIIPSDTFHRLHILHPTWSYFCLG